MNVIVASLQGRFGNQVLTWLFCRALAERTHSELRVAPWIGERIFQIDQPRPDTSLPIVRLNAIEALQWAYLPFEKKYDIEVRDYCQHQPCMIYTKRHAQAWLKLRPESETDARSAVSSDCNGVPDVVVCHQRRGDYAGYGYPVVSQQSYRNACAAYGLEWSHPGMSFLTEEDPTPHSPLPDDMAFVADFYRMVKAPTLLRGNSSFSWLAALLGNGLVLSPVIAGLEGGKEHDCQFVAGNHPRLANFDFTTDLYVSP